MKIDDNNLAALSAQTTRIDRTNETARAGQSRHASGAGGADGDHVEISGLGAAIAAEQSDSPERAAKIDQLAAVYQSGKYQVNSQVLARDILGESASGTGGQTG